MHHQSEYYGLLWLQDCELSYPRQKEPRRPVGTIFVQMLMERLHRTAAAIFLAIAVPWILFGGVYSFQESHGRKIGRGGDQSAENQFHNEQNGIWGHSDPGVTLVTMLLVIVGAVQVGLFLAQLRLIRESLDPAKEAADAAN